jgi:hypothetical protein
MKVVKRIDSRASGRKRSDGDRPRRSFVDACAIVRMTSVSSAVGHEVTLFRIGLMVASPLEQIRPSFRAQRREAGSGEMQRERATIAVIASEEELFRVWLHHG